VGESLETPLLISVRYFVNPYEISDNTIDETISVILIIRVRILWRVYQISEHLLTRQILVRVLLCTLYTTCFGPDQWPSSGDLQHKI
jgi:hypothetical protein